MKEATSKVCGSLVDFLIWYAALVGASVGKSGPRGVYESFREADKIMESVNHRSLIATWNQIFKKKLLTYEKRKNLYHPVITDYGRQRLNEIVPQYRTDRPWDGRIYLITYDIPEKVRVKRESLRDFLLRINSQMLQESTYINPYNPRQLVANFIKDHRIPGAIIISDIGPDGGIGEETIQNLLVRLYNLEKINDRYDEFIKKAKNERLPNIKIMFEYLSILKEDPQLPFSLLPKDWLGEKANMEYEKLRRKYINGHAAAG